MSYIDSTLMKDEKVLYRTHPHWIIFMPVAVWLLIFTLLYWYGPQYEITRFDFGIGLPLYKMFAWIVLLLTVIAIISAVIRYAGSEYGITNKRVLVKVGFIRRATLEILIPKIESIKINQTVMGRILDYGSITISGVGGSQDPFMEVPQPLEFRKMIQTQIDKDQQKPQVITTRIEPEIGL